MEKKIIEITNNNQQLAEGFYNSDNHNALTIASFSRTMRVAYCSASSA